MTKQHNEFTFKHNISRGRHGWLRLTPAYSVTLVEKLLTQVQPVSHVLDPFCGTGTTGVVCAQQGIECDLTEINPFLIWLARAKTEFYVPEHIDSARNLALAVIDLCGRAPDINSLWIPPISHIERWWNDDALGFLAKLHHALSRVTAPNTPEHDLLMIAFCRLLIDISNAAFNHQSTSFKTSQMLELPFDRHDVYAQQYLSIVDRITAAANDLISVRANIFRCDARDLHILPANTYDCVITSPPYPNRMSYIRELRPYMYWLGYLKEAREAGELDWQAIGGTWGIATSRVGQWQPNGHNVDLPDMQATLGAIWAESPLLANYVHKYFVDMSLHFAALKRVLKSGAKLYYVIGNSKFYDTVVPVAEWYAALMRQHGYESVNIDILRKRNSKKELFEYVISAAKP